MPNGNPILPSSRSNPVGQVRRIREASRAWGRHIQGVRQWLAGEFAKIPREFIRTNHLHANRYEYAIDLTELRRIIREMERRLGSDAPRVMMVNRVMAAYEEATADSVVNLSRITDEYTRTVTQVIRSAPYQRRVALIRARVFEEMEGFAGDTARELGRVLSQGIENGLNPRDITGDLSERFGVSRSRAERIARTEITQAHRRGRLDEATEAQERLGIQTKMLWLSALSPTTRENHAARHGNLYTQDEVREFYSDSGESINCKCSQVETLVDDRGNPATPDVVRRVKAQR